MKGALNTKQIEEWLVAQVCGLMEVEAKDLDIHQSFAHYGLSSKDVVTLSGELEELLGRRLSPTLAYEYPSIATLAKYLGENKQGETPQDINGPKTQSDEPIAIVGMGCRFPGAKDPQAYWQMLKAGEDKITEVPADRWPREAFYDPDPGMPGKAISYWGGFLESIDQFDPFFFGISPIEAKHMDPQQRLLMELSYEALDDAGFEKDSLDGSQTGVFMGVSVNEYGHFQFGDPEVITSHSGTGSALSIAANRISYFYNFRGPSMAIDTACSSSLTAVHLACQSLRNGESNLALAGGVNLILSPAHSIAFTKAGVLARDGRCKTFDANADGYVRGEGGGIIVLKRLSAALADGDHIHAVINGSTMSQDGRTNGLMAPSQDSQEAMLRQAYRDAGVAPDSVQYVEAHGTGTLLGDAMEASALGAVLGAGREGAPCAIGSVKTNIGHLEAAAGIAGLLKVVLAMKHNTLPPSLHYSAPNPHVDFEALNLKVQNEATEWPETSGLATAGISSFGFGGTNVHLILSKQTTKKEKPLETNQTVLLPLSADSEQGLMSQAASFRDLLGDETVNLQDLCYMAGLKRAESDHRLAVTAKSPLELKDGLAAFLKREQYPGLTQGYMSADDQPKAVFVFSGQGGQWLGMGRDLIDREPVFRETIEQVDKAIQARFKWSLLEELQADLPASRFDEVAVIQPAIFAIQVGLAGLWESWGIKPDAVAGHSMGEVAAACVAGILTLEDAIRVICIRSQQLQILKGKGTMLATELTKEQALEYVASHAAEISIAAINGPTSTVLSGCPTRLEAIMKKLEAENLFCRWVKVDVASHSPQIEAIAPEVSKNLKNLSPQPSAVPFFSTVTASLSFGLDLDAAYWVQNLRKPVLLSDTVTQLLEEGYNSFIELGPHPILLSSIQQSVKAEQNISMLPSMQRETESREVMLTALGKLYTQGVSIEWEQLYPGPHAYSSLPSRPWQRDRYWMDTPKSSAGMSWHQRQSDSGKHPLLGDKIDLAHSPSSHTWQSELSLDQLSYLEDHKVEGLTVFPATGYLEIAFQVAKELGFNKSHAIRDLNFQQLMTLNHDRPRSIQVFLEPNDSGNHQLSIYSRESSKDRWTKHVSASLVKTSVAEPVRQGLPESESDVIDPQILYTAFESRGIQYGPDFQGIENLIREENRVWGRVSLPQSLSYQTDSYQWHPALLDACLQVLGVAIEDSGIKGLYVPSGCENIKVHATATGEIWSSVSLRDSGGTNQGSLIADIHVFDEAGQLLIELNGFHLKSLQAATPGKQQRKDTWLYQPQWRVKNIPESVEPTAVTNKHWLILADDEGLGESLAMQFEAAGNTCQLLAIDSKDTESTLIQRIDNCLKEAPSEIHGIIHFWSLSVSDRLGETSGQADGIYSLGVESTLYLVQALAKRFAGSPRLWLVTRGAQPVNSGEGISLEQSTLWGLGKVISFELPEIKCVRVDLDPQQPNAEAKNQLMHQIAIDDDDDQIAFRGADRFVMRLLPFQPGAHALSGLSFQADATYLITGGMGGLGLTTASWMAAQGAKNFVLLGRSEPSSEASQVVEEMLEAGANVIVAQADVTDRDQVQEIFEKIKAHMPPLKGVIHAAGLLDDGSLLNLNRERMQKVMAPKVNGTWYLHEATARLELDFFVLYSSAVSVLGSPGQGNYAAASAYLDAMAWYRQYLGLPAQSINWGPWAEVGLAAEAAERLKEQNASTQHLVKEIKINQGLEVLEMLMKEPDPQVVVLPFDLKNLLELYPTAAGMSFFAEVGGSETHLTRLYARPKLEQAYVAPSTDVEKKLTELWEQTLHIDKVGIHDSFFELGGDSVLAAQILSLVRKTYGISISPQEAFKAFTIEQLAKQLEAEIMNQIMSMSDEEAERLLGEQN